MTKHTFLLLMFFCIVIFYRAEGLAQNSTSPPQFPVRATAEFEPSSDVVISWAYYPGFVFNEVESFLVKNIQLAGAKVQLIVRNLNMKTEIENYLNSLSPPIPTNNIEFVFYEPQEWTRDYSAQSIFFGSENLPGWVDVDYNRGGSEDADDFPEFFSSLKSIPLFSADVTPVHLKNQGGNFLTDGFGFGISVESVLQQNNQDLTLIESIFNDYYGIHEIHIVEGVHWALEHIDLFMKFLDEETLLVGQYEGEFGEGVELALQYIMNTYLSIWDRPFKIVRIPAPNFDPWPTVPYQHGQYYSYTNSLIINNYVLVPIFGKAEDSGALAIYREAMPGYIVVAHDLSSQILQDPNGNFSRGFIHCLSHEITREDTFIPTTGELPIDMDVPDGVYDKFYTLVSKNSMTLDGSVQVKAGGHVRTKSDGKIVMGSGFSVEKGAYFRAAIN